MLEKSLRSSRLDSPSFSTTSTVDLASWEAEMRKMKDEWGQKEMKKVGEGRGRSGKEKVTSWDIKILTRKMKVME